MIAKDTPSISEESAIGSPYLCDITVSNSSVHDDGEDIILFTYYFFTNGALTEQI